MWEKTKTYTSMELNECKLIKELVGDVILEFGPDVDVEKLSEEDKERYNTAVSIFKKLIGRYDSGISYNEFTDYELLAVDKEGNELIGTVNFDDYKHLKSTLKFFKDRCADIVNVRIVKELSLTSELSVDDFNKLLKDKGIL